MNTRRWLALLIAIVLIIMSIGFKIVMTLASGMLNDLFKFEMTEFQENTIRDGSFTDKIVVLHLEGTILDEEVPLFWEGYNHQRMLDEIEQAFTDPTVKAVILRVNSPGGGVSPTAEIHRKLKELKAEYDKPFYVSMGSVAASGGYYVATPADKIFAEAATITGSIGVIMQNINFSGLAEKYGIKENTIKSGKHKDIMSTMRDMTDEEREILQAMVDEMYDEFVQVIVEGRKMDEKTVRKLGDGRVYTGKQAQEVGLVDEVGNLDDTIDKLMEEHQLNNARVVEYSHEVSIFSQFSMMAYEFFQKDSEIDVVTRLLERSDQPRLMYIY